MCWLAMKMQPQPVVEIPAGKSVEFKPGDYHVMLVGLTRDLKFGENFEFTLQFAKAAKSRLRPRYRSRAVPRPI